MANKGFLNEDEVLDVSQLETPKPDGKVVVNTMFLPNEEVIDYTSDKAPEIPRYTKVYGDTIGPDLERNFIVGQARNQMWEEGFQKNIADAFKYIDTFGGVPEGFEKLNFKAQCQMLANIYAQRAAKTDNASEREILGNWATTLTNYANGIRNTYQERLNAVNLHYGTPLGAGPDEDGGANPNNRYSGTEPQKYVLPELEGVSRDSAFRIPFKDSWGTKTLGERAKTAQENVLDHNVVTELGGGLLGLPFLKEKYDRDAVGMDYKDLDMNGKAKQIAVPFLRTGVLVSAPWLSPIKAGVVGALDAPLVGMSGNDPAAQWNPEDEFVRTPTGEKVLNSGIGALASGSGSAVLGMGSFATGKLASTLGKKYPKLPVIGENAKKYKKQMQEIDKLRDDQYKAAQEIQDFPSERLVADEMAADAAKRSEELGRDIPVDDLWKHNEYSVTLQPDERMQTLFPKNYGKRTFKGTFGQFTDYADDLSKKADEKIVRGVDDLTGKINRWGDQQRKAMDKVSDFSNQQKARESEVAAARRELDELKPIYAESVEAFNEAQGKKAAHKAEIDAAKEMQLEDKAKWENAGKDYAVASDDYNAVNDPYQSLKNELSNKRQLYKAEKSKMSEHDKLVLEGQIKKLEDQFAELTKARVEAKETFQPFKEAKRQMYRQKVASSTLVDDLKSQNKGFSEAVNKAKKERDEWGKEMEKQNRILDKKTIAYGDSIAKYTAKADDLSGFIKQGMEDLAKLREDRKKVAEEYQILIKEKGPELYRNATNSRYSATANDAIESKRKELAKIEAQIAKLEATLPEKPSRIGSLIGYGLVVPYHLGGSVRNSFVDNLTQSKLRGEYNVDFLKNPPMSAAEERLNAYSEMVDSPTSYKSRARRYILGSDR